MAWKDWFAQSGKVATAVSGKKTHLTVIAALALAFMEAFGIWKPPEWVWLILGAAGVGFLRVGVKNTKTSIEQMIKEIEMKKLVIILAALLAMFMGSAARANGLTLWGLTEQDLGSTQRAISARAGYQYGFIEPFIGSTWRPDYDVKAGQVKPPQVLSFGTLIHARDLLDPNNPLPWIPDLLLTFIPEDFVAQPYLGAQGTWNFFDKDAGFYGPIVGILAKTQAESKASFVAEAQWNKNFDDLNALPDKFRLNLGFRFYFP